MAVALSDKGPVIATDANPALIALYRAVRAGWEPPTIVSREEHQAAKNLPDEDPRKALIGFGSSFGGAWFGSYAGGLNGKLTYAELAARNVKRSAPVPAAVGHLDFFSVPPAAGELLYLDPPYKGTAGYAATGAFDHDRFYARVKEWSLLSPVFVSEYSLPFGTQLWERTAKTTFGLKAGALRTERLYLIGDWKPLDRLPSAR